jgi:hypothetical protein
MSSTNVKPRSHALGREEASLASAIRRFAELSRALVNIEMPLSRGRASAHFYELYGGNRA